MKPWCAKRGKTSVSDTSVKPWRIFTDTLAGCLAPAIGAAPDFVRVFSLALFAWLLGTTTAARRVLLLCLSGLAFARLAKPQDCFQGFSFAVPCPFKAASAAGRVGAPFADKLPLILGILLRQLFLFRWPKNHWISTRQAALYTFGEFTSLTEPVM